MSLLELSTKCRAATAAGHGFVALLSNDIIDAGSTALLTLSERQRAERFLRGDDRKNFIVARTVLRSLVVAGEASNPIQFGIHGKPYVQDGLAFNVSHSGNMVGVAISGAEPVGIDIEAIDNFETGLADVVLSSAEKYWISQQPSKAEAFYRCWTRKEALLKAAGLGLIGDLRTIDCSTVETCLTMEETTEVQLYELSHYLDGSYAACAVFPRSTPEIHLAVPSSLGCWQFERLAAHGIPYRLPRQNQNGKNQ